MTGATRCSPRRRPAVGIPKSVLNTVRIPLTAFNGIDLSDVRKVTFRHNVSDKGAVLTTDLAFTDPS